MSLCRRMHGESRYAFLPFDESRMIRWIDVTLGDRQRRCGLVAIVDDNITGMLAGYVTEYFFCEERVACDQVLYVTPARRGTWAARSLMKAFRRWAEERGAREIVLGVTTGIDPVRTGKLYETAGYSFVGGNYSCRLTPGPGGRCGC